MTDQHIGPHGIGCKCPPQEHGSSMRAASFYRGDLSAPGRQVYEILFGGEKRSEAPGRILIELNTHSPRVIDAMAYMREGFSDIFQDMIEAHTQQILGEVQDDPITQLLKLFFGDDISKATENMPKPGDRVNIKRPGPAPKRENEQDVNN